MIVYELHLSQFGSVGSLFEDVWIDRALIESVIEGIRPARVFVDDFSQPTTALMCGLEFGEYFIIGDSNPGPVRQFIKDMPSEAEVFNRERFAYFMPDISWEQALLEDRDGAIKIFSTRSFWHKELGIKPLEQWKSHLNQKAEVRVIDGDLLTEVDAGKIKSWDEFGKEDLERIFRERFGFCTVLGDQIVSVASALNLSSRYASVSIDTFEPYRRREMATLACVVFIEHCLAESITPIWNCLESNTASGALAIKLGMDEGPPQRESGWAPFQWQYETTRGHWTREDHPSVKAIWHKTHPSK